ncbi:PTS system, beta-glucoside-specific IIA component [Spiroplasma chinense]|uniref:PTS system, beta-glucoside-specific IIA component n=1 Tax=Spiroplasma chinense TaxID=216932 RepID=A0A5B9Y4K2_9MOLU|nr:PTS glucose transporter subunit IIA [Spiroplasma chinense]QEH61971.1 PTS system, beta-glucoside-specific IIA component [Spiroplasma chinense]
MEKIKIYSPVDGFVDAIENMSDEVFSNKMLGDGFLVKPKSNDFYSFFEKANVEMIFDTKHAIALKDEKTNCVGLMHIGLDTVTLKGEPFEVKTKLQESVGKEQILVSADLLTIEKKNIKTDTAVVFEVNQFENFNFELLKKGEVKHGDLIAEITFDKAVETNNEMIELIKQENQFLRASKTIFKSVGSKENINDFYNCMTRLRIVVKDPKKVEIEKIKKIDIVKGINWNGNELQIIIGGTVVKLKEEFQMVYDNVDRSIKVENKQKWYKKIMPTITGIMMPTIPVLMTIGLIGALYNILLLTGAVKGLPESGNVLELDVMSGVLYILSKVGLNLIGIIFIYTTVRYLKGNTVMAIFIGFTLITPLFVFDGVNGWELFKVGNTSISAKNYVDSMLPFIIAGFIYFYLDKWVKTWMPSSIDVVFRHTLCYLFTILITLFAVGPIFGLLEEVMARTFLAFEKLPVGIGVAIFAFLWQILVLTGSHVAVVVAMQPAAITLGYSVIYLGVLFAPWGQVAASLGVAAKTKDSRLKQVAYASLPAGIFGITEPIIYGITLPRLKPFIFGCIASAAGVLVAANTGAFVDVKGYFTMGIVTLLSIGPKPIFILWAVIGLAVTFGISFSLTYFFDVDRVTEYNGVKKTIKKIAWKYSKLSKNNIKKSNDELKTMFAKDLELLKTNQNKFIEYEKEFVKFQKISIKIEKLNEKEEKIKDSLYKKALRNKNKEEYKVLAEQYNNFNLNDKKQPLITRKQEIVDGLDKQKVILEEIRNNCLLELENKVDQLTNTLKFNQISEYKNDFYNDLNSLEIFFGNIDKKEFKFDNKLYKKELTKRRELNA